MLEKLIAMVVVFCVLSLMVTILQEAVQQLLSLRGLYLWYHLRRLLRDVQGDDERKAEIDLRRNGHLVRWLGQKHIHTAYGQALLHPVTNPVGLEIPQHVNAADLFHVLGAPGAGKLVRHKAHVELADFQRWFDALMAYVAAGYRGKMRILGFVISLCVVGVANASLGRMYRAVADTQVRQELLLSAEQKDNDSKHNLASASEGLQLGWRSADELRAGLRPGGWTLLGAASVVSMALLLSLGAPFWFELLNRVMALRSGSRPPQVTSLTDAPHG